jgi:hypothetical protein
MSRIARALALAGAFALAVGSAPAAADGPPSRPETRPPGFYNSPTDESAAPRMQRPMRVQRGGTSLAALFRTRHFDVWAPLTGDPASASGPVYSYMPETQRSYHYAPAARFVGTALPAYHDPPCPTRSLASLAELFSCVR